MEPGKRERHLVVFVHGTGDTAFLGGDRRRWWQGGSRFTARLHDAVRRIREELKETEDHTEAPALDYAAFRWNGINKQLMRRRAAFNLYDWMRGEELAETRDGEAVSPVLLIGEEDSRGRLPAEPRPGGERIPAFEDYDKVHFVAHSHGGNVVMEALLLCAADTDILDNTQARIGRWVTVGTPFLRTEPSAPWLMPIRFLRRHPRWFLAPLAALAMTFAISNEAGGDLSRILTAFSPQQVEAAGELGSETESIFIAKLKEVVRNRLGGEVLGERRDGVPPIGPAAQALRWVLTGAGAAALAVGTFAGVRHIRTQLRLRRKRRQWYRRLGELRRRSARSRILGAEKAVRDAPKLSKVYSEDNYWRLHELFGQGLVNLYSRQDEAVAALSRFDLGKRRGFTGARATSLLSWLAGHARAATLTLGLGAALFFLPFLGGWAAGDPDGFVLAATAGLALYAIAAFYVVPMAISGVSKALANMFWGLIRRRGLGVDGSYGGIVNAGASPSRFNDHGRKRGSFARLGDLRDAPLPVKVEAELYVAAHETTGEEAADPPDYVGAADLIDGQDDFLAFVASHTGSLPLIHTSYFKSSAVTAQIAYGLLHDLIDRKEGKQDMPNIDTLRDRARVIGRSYDEEPASEPDAGATVLPLRRTG
jgi:hypothetical protein